MSNEHSRGSFRPLALAIKSLAGLAAVGLLNQASAQSLQLEEVIVTAQKRTENVQDIPLTINVVSDAPQARKTAALRYGERGPLKYATSR